MRFSMLFLFLFCTSCSGVLKAKKIKKHISTNPIQVVWDEKKDNNIEITYIGCGGFLLKDKATSVLIDPYFSNISPMISIFFKKLKPDTTLIDNFFHQTINNKKDLEGNIKAILVGHSHYDHLADIPTVLNRNCNLDSVEIIGSKTTGHILAGANISKQVKVINSNNWIYTKNKRVRILPIPSNHAPHIFGIKLISSKKATKDFSKFPKKVRKFPEGENYNFLIDYLDAQGNVTFRIFSNASAASDDGVGFPSSELLKQKQVDVLLLCVASYNQVQNHPEGIVKFINPKYIIGNHWENFSGLKKRIKRNQQLCLGQMQKNLFEK